MIQCGKLNLWSTHLKTEVPCMFYTKFHLPMSTFYLPSSKCTQIGEQVSISFPHCSDIFFVFSILTINHYTAHDMLLVFSWVNIDKRLIDIPDNGSKGRYTLVKTIKSQIHSQTVYRKACLNTYSTVKNLEHGTLLGMIRWVNARKT